MHALNKFLSLHNLALISVLSLAAILFHGKSDLVHMKAFDSAVHARIALNLTEKFPTQLKPNLPIPHPLNRDLPAFNDHPFPLFYLSGIWARLFGVSLQSLRFIPGLVFPLLCIFWVFRLGRWIGNGRFMAGFLPALILTLSPYFTRGGNGFQLEPAQTFFILLSFEALLKQKFTKGSVFTVFGIWIKHPVSLLPFLAVGFENAIQKNFKAVVKTTLFAVMTLALGLSIWWITDALSQGEKLSIDYFNRQVFGTAVSGRGFGHQWGFWFFIKILLTKWQPWFLILLITIAVYGRRPLRERFIDLQSFNAQALRTIAWGALFIYLIISMMAFRYEHYYYPIYPLLALCIGVSWSGFLEKVEKSILVFIVTSVLVFSALFSSSGMFLSAERYPELRGLMPYLVQFGDCKKPVWIFEGPYSRGGAQEHRIEIALHAAYERTEMKNAKTLDAIISDTSTLPASTFPEWILIPESTFQNDLTENIRMWITQNQRAKLQSGNLLAIYFGEGWNSEFRSTSKDTLKIKGDCP